MIRCLLLPVKFLLAAVVAAVVFVLGTIIMQLVAFPIAAFADRLDVDLFWPWTIASLLPVVFALRFAARWWQRVSYPYRPTDRLVNGPDHMRVNTRARSRPIAVIGRHDDPMQQD